MVSVAWQQSLRFLFILYSMSCDIQKAREVTEMESSPRGFLIRGARENALAAVYFLLFRVTFH